MAELAEELLAEFDSVDTSGDGQLTFTEVLALVPSLTQARFAEMDRNSDGVLTEEELRDIIDDDGPNCRERLLGLFGLRKSLGDVLVLGGALIVAAFRVRQKN
ncbi:MAG: hypothetical protein HYZ00_08240 [Candidatus Hydrogenedentes bacterium]|nr:hypothetical protein [Candidatus Hydrogenedentota bacterium]